jgi:hypothetical protein
VQPVDFGRAHELIERGYEDSGAYLDAAAGQERAAVPFSMSMHAHSG